MLGIRKFAIVEGENLSYCILLRKWVRGMNSDLIDVRKGQALAFKNK